MSEEPKPPADPKKDPSPEPSPIDKLRAEFQEQFSTLKTTFETENAKNLETITALQKENEELHRALIRSAVTPPAEPEQPKSEEEIYADRIIELSKKSIAIEKRQRGLS